MKALPHNFKANKNGKEISDVADLAVIVGYQKCLTDLFNMVREAEMGGYVSINTSTLIELIQATTKELVWLNNPVANQVETILQSNPKQRRMKTKKTLANIAYYCILPFAGIVYLVFDNYKNIKRRRHRHNLHRQGRVTEHNAFTDKF